MGSLTKTITATVLLQLVQEQKVALDDPIGKYVESIPNDEATLRQLADMTSGIPIYSAQQAFQDALFARPQESWTPSQLISYIRDVKPDFPPGKGWEYDNTNYVLLGMVIEKVTGAPIAKVYQDRIFGPLQMTETSFPNDSTVLPEPYLSGVTSQGQLTGKSADSTHWNPSSAYTAGAVISTFSDLKKWADALFTGKGILDPATQQLRRDRSSATFPPRPPKPATASASVTWGRLVGPRRGSSRLHHHHLPQLPARHHHHRGRQQRHHSPRDEPAGRSGACRLWSPSRLPFLIASLSESPVPGPACDAIPAAHVDVSPRSLRSSKSAV